MLMSRSLTETWLYKYIDGKLDYLKAINGIYCGENSAGTNQER